jgi:hypothetical protein
MQTETVEVVAPAEGVIELKAEREVDIVAYSQDIIPLLQFCGNIPEALAALDVRQCAFVEHTDYILYTALRFTLLTLKKFSKLRYLKSISKIVNKLYVGLVKKTDKHDNALVKKTDKHDSTSFQEFTERKAEYEAIIMNLFADIMEPHSASYFMLPEIHEMTSARCIYANLKKNELMKAGTSVCGIFGIGKNFVHWVIPNKNGQKKIMVGLQVGMNKPAVLKESSSSKVLISKMQKKKYGHSLVDAMSDLCKNGTIKRAVIALTSGCIILLEKKEYADIRQMLTKKPKLKKSKLKKV